VQHESLDPGSDWTSFPAFRKRGNIGVVDATIASPPLVATIRKDKVMPSTDEFPRNADATRSNEDRDLVCTVAGFHRSSEVEFVSTTDWVSWR